MSSFPILELLQDCCEPPATRHGLEELELTLGIRFPKEYSEFLLKFNGGHFRLPAILYLPTPTQWVNRVGVRSFYGDPADRDSSSAITLYAHLLEGRIPADCLAIADSDGLDLIMLQVAGPKAQLGRVWFWDGVDEGEGNNIHWIADSFNEFLSLLLVDVCNCDPERERVPIFQAVERGDLRAVEAFLAQPGRVEFRNARGQTLLAAAAAYSWPKIVQLLLLHSADPNARDRKGRTPLHHAATSSFDSVKLLLEAGSDPKARDRKGQGVVAEWSYRIDDLLRAHGAEG